jgi:hypothetical protein
LYVHIATEIRSLFIPRLPSLFLGYGGDFFTRLAV